MPVRSLKPVSTSNRTRSRATRLLPFLAVLQLSTIVAEFAASVAFEPRYNWVKNTISELGVRVCTTNFDPRSGVEVCSPLHGFVNGAMTVSGLSLILLAVFARHIPGFMRVAGVLWAAAGVGAIATGLVSLDVSPVMHQMVSLLLFFGGPLAIVVGAFQYHGTIRWCGLIIGGVGLVLGAIFGTSDAVYGFGGVIERIVVWSSSAWVVFLIFRYRRQHKQDLDSLRS